jgi:transcriptional regulator with XRE-family HTH domain
MDSRAQALEVRSKLIGVLLRSARLKACRTLKDCAGWLGCSPHIMSQYEYGRRAISLPELELLSELWRVPVNELWDEQAAVVDQPTTRPPAEKLLQLRHKEIGIQLRQARSMAGKTQKQCADILGVSTETVSKYEYGSKAVPFPHLELLADLLGVPLSDFLDRELATELLPAAVSGPELRSPAEAWAALSAPIQQLICRPDSLPYLEMAVSLYELPKSSLRHLAKAMLATED